METMEEEETLLGILSRPAKRSNRLKRYKWILIPTGALFLLLALAGTTAVSQSIVPLSSTPTAAAAVVPIESPSLSFYSAKIIPTPTATLAPSHTPTRIARRRYLSYQPHSGFHNQRMELTNALTLATLLNRTLLLPPVRLGAAQPWATKLQLEQYLQEDEENKRRCTDRSIDTIGHDPTPETGSENTEHEDENEMIEADDDLRRRQLDEEVQCDEKAANKWTYLPWSHLLHPAFLAQFSLVPRNNISRAYLSSPAPDGLGISPADTYYFDDADRRSVRIFDLTAKQMERGDGFKGRFKQSLTIEQLSAIPSATEGRREGDFTREFGDYELLHFGSLFASSRLSFTNSENKKLKSRIENGVILGNAELGKLSSFIRDALGDYVGVHARVGDGAFKKFAKSNMADVFYHTCKALGLSDDLIESLYPRQTPYTVFVEPTSRKSKSTSRQARRSAIARREERLDEYDDFETGFTLTPLSPLDSFPTPPTIQSLQNRAPPAASLRCRSPLHIDPKLLPLNRPIYLATDSKSPATDIALKPFFDHFPCLFTLADFAFPLTSTMTPSTSEHVSNAKGSHIIQEVVDLAKVVNSWDGQPLGRFLWPFLEAEIVAKGKECQGTSGSTFSVYACGLLHQNFTGKSRVDWSLKVSHVSS